MNLMAQLTPINLQWTYFNGIESNGLVNLVTVFSNRYNILLKIIEGPMLSIITLMHFVLNVF